MSQSTLFSEPYVNSNLFSSHYLNDRVRDREEWDCDEDAREMMRELQSLYEMEGELVKGYNEDALVDNWISEVLDILGYGRQEEPPLPEGGGFVDELLFEDEGTRREAAAASIDKDGTAELYDRAVGLLEAKQWDADFTERFSEGRPYRNASHQVKHYLENTPENVTWGILTNGRKWRLYGTKDYETQTYYEVDLPELLEGEDLRAFKYFYLFFRPDALRKSTGTTFLDEVWSESETAAQELGEDLQDNVFTALRVLGRGFVETNNLDIDPGDEAALDELKEQSLVLLYRLMFVLYAEGRDLIHPEDPAARDEYEENFSLDSLRAEVHEEIGGTDSGFQSAFSDYSTTMWSRLSDLFRLIDEGEEDLGIPPYNGGLFDHEEHAFLTDNEVSNQYLAEVIYRLSTTRNDEGEYVLADYADLDTRHLGSVYEGLLEHQFRIAPEEYAAVSEDGGQVWKPATGVTVADAVETVPEGGLYVVNDEGERKATGAYYTPDYVVTYIVEETVGPLVDEIREDLTDQGFTPGTQEYLGAFLRRVTDLKILDPAMGSGHFLTKATGYLTEQIMEEVRDIETEVGAVFDEQLIRREIAKECIYGVDLNGMAVELAKLSMWLETLSADRPLAFLDHHLKEGNSLVGSDIEAIEELESDAADEDDQASLAQFGATREGTIERLIDIYGEFLAIENEDIEDVREMKRRYAEIEQDELRRRLVAMANVHTAERFDLDVPGGAYEQMAKALEDDSAWEDVEGADWFKTAQAMADDYGFFHWKLAFPEVFYNIDGSIKSEAGFDTVIGNPPWVSNWELTESNEQIVSALESLYPNITVGHWDIFVPFSYRAMTLTKPSGSQSFITPTSFGTEKYGTELRKKLVNHWTIHQLVHFGEYQVFDDVDRQYLIYIISPRETEGGSVDLLKYDEREFSTSATVSQEDFSAYSNYSLRPSLVGRDIELKKKMERQSTSTGRICCVNVGVVAHAASDSDLEFKKDDVIYEGSGEGFKKYIQGSNISPYLISWDGEYIDYESKISHFHRPKFPELFESEKVVIPRVSGAKNRIEACFDPDGFYNNDNVTNVVLWTDEIQNKQVPKNFEPLQDTSNFDLKEITGVLNSSLITYYFSQFLATGTLQGSYSSIYPEDIRKIPIEDELGLSANGDSKLRNQVDIILKTKKERASLNLDLLDYIKPYSDGPTLTEIGQYQPPEGVGDSKLAATKDDLDSLRVGTVTVERESAGEITIFATARYKPEDEDAYETDQWGYTESEPMPAMRLTDLSETEADLVEAFVPMAVDEAGGFAGFRETATKTNSLVDRLSALTLPDPDDVADGLARYVDARERAEELDEKIEKTDALIDEIVYELYGLTDEEIEIVEEAVEG
jgi:type I restriction-modification system DNA methylase subunit